MILTTEEALNCDCQNNRDGTVTLSLDIHNAQWNKLLASGYEEEATCRTCDVDLDIDTLDI